MDAGALGLIEMAAFFGVAVAWGAWELRSLARLRRQREADATPVPPGDDPPAAARDEQQ